MNDVFLNQLRKSSWHFILTIAAGGQEFAWFVNEQDVWCCLLLKCLTRHMYVRKRNSSSFVYMAYCAENWLKSTCIILCLIDVTQCHCHHFSYTRMISFHLMHTVGYIPKSPIFFICIGFFVVASWTYWTN